jgi:phage gpG-like protein
MQDFQQLFNQLLKDIRVELNDEFDRNFERKAFFDRAWKPALRNNIGSLLIRTGALRSSLQSTIFSNSITWTSSLPYADMQNNGATLVVTVKMKGFFWYQYRLATGGNSKNRTPESEFWKALALKQVGSTIVIPPRKFIGEHPIVDRHVAEVTTEWFNNDVKNYLDNTLNKIVQ